MNNRYLPAIDALKAGGVIAYPTEAVFGLGCDPFNIEAIERLFAIKQRPKSRQFILIAHTVAQLETLLCPLETLPYYKQILASWPGPTTWIIPAAPRAPRWLVGDTCTLAVRVTAHPIAARLCAEFAGPIVSTSANRNGKAPIRSLLTLRYQFHQQLDTIVAGALGNLAQPTQIRHAISGVYLR